MTPAARLRVVFGINLLLYFAIGQLNSVLSGYVVYLHLDALLVLFFGLFMVQSKALVYVVLFGLLADSQHGSPPGTYLLGYTFLWAFFVWCQRRIHRVNPAHVSWIAVSGQLLLMFALAFALAGEARWLPGYWGRLGWEWLCSSLLIYLVAPLWCRVQKEALQPFGWQPEVEMRNA